LGCSAALDDASTTGSITWVGVRPHDPKFTEFENRIFAEEFRSVGEIRNEPWRSAPR